MKNVSNWRKVVQIVAGICLSYWGAMRSEWWMVLGFVPLLNAHLDWHSWFAVFKAPEINMNLQRARPRKIYQRWSLPRAA